MEPGKRLIDNCIRLLEQAGLLLDQLSAEIYSSTSPISPRGSIGGHLRHVLDFFDCFLLGLESGRIDNNQRRRHLRVETDRRYAGQRIAETIVRLRAVTVKDYDATVLVCGENDGVNELFWIRSSVLRELEALQSHTIHHYSLIAMLLRLQETEPGAAFGVAPSTLNHWREEALCAQ